MAASVAIAAPVPLPSLNIDPDQTSVSGLSSGAYMATQFHIAHSSSVMGAGIIAGGPYYCAQDNQTTAITTCSCTGLLPCRPQRALTMVPDLVDHTEDFAAADRIDRTAHLRADRVWLFSGQLDSTVPPALVDALDKYYRHYVDVNGIVLNKSVAAAHAMPTDTFGNGCDFKGEPYINNCGFDAAGELLTWIYPGLNPRNAASSTGTLIEFDQNEFLVSAETHGLWPTGWVYVPAACATGARCRAHIAFHGCKQYPGRAYADRANGVFGDTFARHAGYNQWADTNNIVVLYPQANVMLTRTRLPRINPNGCWDWWGYDDDDYANKNGRQIAAVKAMLDRLTGVGPTASTYCETEANARHVLAGRAYIWLFWFIYAVGSDDYLGMNGLTSTTLRQTASSHYEKVDSCE